MRWPWRRARGRHTAPAVDAAAWVPVSPEERADGEAPAVVAEPTATPELLPQSAGAAELEPPLQPVSPTDPDASAETPTGVRLGFEDGSEVQLASDDPRVDALRAVADVLMERGRS